MGNVVISPNIKKESVRIDPQGNIIDPRTKQVKDLGINEIEVVTPQDMIPKVVTHETPTEIPKTSKMDEMINKLVEKKVEEMVAKKVEEALSKL